MKVNKGDLIKVVYWAHDDFDNDSILILNMTTGRMQVLDLETNSGEWIEESHFWALSVDSIDDTLKNYTNGSAVLESYYA